MSCTERELYFQFNILWCCCRRVCAAYCMCLFHSKSHLNAYASYTWKSVQREGSHDAVAAATAVYVS